MDENTLFARICRLAGSSSFVESAQAKDADRYCKRFTAEVLFKVLVAAQLKETASMWVLHQREWVGRGRRGGYGRVCA